MRFMRFIAMVLGIWLASFIARAVVSNIQPRGAFPWLAGAITPSLLLFPFVARVGYRRRDALLAALPIAGTFFLWVWLWRLASLPNRYWDQNSTPARDDIPAVPAIEKAIAPGAFTQSHPEVLEGVQEIRRLRLVTALEILLTRNQPE